MQDVTLEEDWRYGQERNLPWLSWQQLHNILSSILIIKINKNKRHRMYSYYTVKCIHGHTEKKNIQIDETRYTTEIILTAIASIISFPGGPFHPKPR